MAKKRERPKRLPKGEYTVSNLLTFKQWRNSDGEIEVQFIVARANRSTLRRRRLAANTFKDLTE